MRAAAILLITALGVEAVGAARLQPGAFKGCANLTAITDPDLAAAVKLIQNLELLPAGIPDDATIFLPTNDSLSEVLIGGPIPTPSSDLEVILAQPLLPEIAYRLNAVLLYHVAIIGAATPAELLEEGTIPTSLGPDRQLAFAKGKASGTYTVTDGTGRQGTTGKPANLCGSSIFAIDKVMMPAESFQDIPLVSPDEALCLMTGLGCRAGAQWVTASSPVPAASPAQAPAPAT